MANSIYDIGWSLFIRLRSLLVLGQWRAATMGQTIIRQRELYRKTTENSYQWWS